MALLVLLGMFGGGWFRLSKPLPATDPAFRVRLVQGNVTQHVKWDRAHSPEWLRRYLELTGEAAADPATVGGLARDRRTLPARARQQRPRGGRQASPPGMATC